MSLPVAITLGIVGALFLLLMAWLLWTVEKANRNNPRAKTGTMGGAPFSGSGDGCGGDAGGGGGSGGGDGGGG
jgi:hypothetical protein